MLKPIIKNKRGQEFSPAILVAIFVGLLIFAPIMMRVIGISTGTFFDKMNTTAPGAVSEASSAVDKVYNFFDYLIVIAMLINIILLFISSWFIDTNPAFIILYIMFAFIMVLFLPNVLTSVDKVWSNYDAIGSADPWREDTSLNLPFTEWIKNNFVMFIVVIIALTGIIIYGKFKLGSSY